MEAPRYPGAAGARVASGSGAGARAARGVARTAGGSGGITRERLRAPAIDAATAQRDRAGSDRLRGRGGNRAASGLDVPDTAARRVTAVSNTGAVARTARARQHARGGDVRRARRGSRFAARRP